MPCSSVFIGALCLGLSWALPTALAADFPFDSELMLDANPMKGSKRVPLLDIGTKGETAVELWCNTVEAQIVVVGSTITIITGRKTERQCDAARMRGDEELLESLTQVTGWRREGNVLTLLGPKTLRFRKPSN